MQAWTWTHLTYKEWKKQYKPVLTYHEDVSRLHVWTAIHNSGDGAGYVENGYHFVNRDEYIVTEIPYNVDDHIIVEFKRNRDYNRFVQNFY